MANCFDGAECASARSTFLGDVLQQRVRFSRAALLAASLAAVLAGCDLRPAASPTGKNKAAPLNVVLITLDTTRADALGIYGQTRQTTPEIDRFASTGAVFEWAYSAQPTTLASHSTIMTGKLPFAHGARDNGGYVLPLGNTTLAEVFASHGYVTAAEVAAPVIGRRTQMDQGFRYYRDPESPEVRRKVVQIRRQAGFEKLELVERDARDITAHGTDFIRRYAQERFFLWLHYFDPHHFYAAPPPWSLRFPDIPYYSEVHFMDHYVGEVFEALRREGILEKTLVVITADHGEGLGEHEEDTHSFYLYDSTLRVPLVFVMPGTIPGGLRVEEVVRTADIAPTILELAELPSLDGIQGFSLAPRLLDGIEIPELESYADSFGIMSIFDTSMLRSLRKGQWKYIHKINPELFQIATDQRELRNVASEYPEVLEALRERLIAWVREERETHTDNRTLVDSRTRAELAALGYVSEDGPMDFDEDGDLAVLRGPDPNLLREDMGAYATAIGRLAARDRSAARELLETLHDAHPENLSILKALLSTIEARPRIEREMEFLEAAKTLDPGNPEYLLVAADLFRERGELADEEEQLREVLLFSPCHTLARVALAQNLNRRGREHDQRIVLEEAVRLCEGNLNFTNDLAYLLATSEDTGLRDGRAALQLARRIHDSSTEERADYLDTLACALAEVGDFAEAVVHSRRALELIQRRSVPPEAVSVYRSHLKLFESRQTVSSGAP